MKLKLSTILLTGLVFLAACSNDETSTETEPNNEEQNQTPDETSDSSEEGSTVANVVAENVMIPGGTKEEGTPPTPNEAITLDIVGARKTANLNEGFEIPFSSSGTVTGAYLQFKDKDGEVADGYYDINLSENNVSKESFTKHLGVKRNQKVQSKQSAQSIDVDFNTQIEPGEFCYIVCVYDSEGNISAPQEVCVTIAAWGGYEALLGTWNFVEEAFQEGENAQLTVSGLSGCTEITIVCPEFSYADEECFNIDKGEIVFNADGTYEYDYQITITTINPETYEVCNTIFDTSVYSYQSSGFWSYDETENEFAIVEYNYSEDDNGTQDTGDFEPGEGYLLYFGTIEISDNRLTITETEDEDFNGIPDYIYKEVYEKE